MESYIVEKAIMMSLMLLDVLNYQSLNKKQCKNITVLKFNKFDTETFIKDLKSKNFNQIKTLAHDPNQMWFIWKQLYLDVLTKYTPVANLRIKCNSLPYITAGARAIIKQRDYLRVKANKTESKFLTLRWSSHFG